MYPTIFLGPFAPPSMWISTLCGVLCAMAFLIQRRKAFSLAMVDVTNLGALGLVGILVGGKLLYLLTILPILVRQWGYLSQHWDFLITMVTSGTVFYGGLFGLLAILWWYTRRYQLPQKLVGDWLAPAIPLFHLFGRIGCFLNGCCHGFESDTLGIAYTNSISALNGVPYFPVQLVEAGCNGILFLILWQFEKKHRGEGRALPLHLGLYATVRFCLEFLRGDVVRGIWWGLSTSQWISLGILLILLLRHLISSKKATS